MPATMGVGETSTSSVAQAIVDTQPEDQEAGHAEGQESSHVDVAPAADNPEGISNFQRTIHSYYWMMEGCSVLIICLVLGFAVIFMYAWIDALRKFIEQWVQPRNGVPPHIRKTFHYFIFCQPTDTAAAGKLPQSLMSGQEIASGFQGSTTGSDAQQASAALGVYASDSTRKEIDSLAKGSFTVNNSNEANADSVEGRAMAFPQEETKNQTQHVILPWAYSTLVNCSICLEAYRTGDKMCRLPCFHAFHANCIDTWMDERNVCPQCRLALTTPEPPWRRSLTSPAINGDSLDENMAMPHPLASSDHRAMGARSRGSPVPTGIAHLDMFSPTVSQSISVPSPNAPYQIIVGENVSGGRSTSGSSRDGNEMVQDGSAADVHEIAGSEACDQTVDDGDSSRTKRMEGEGRDHGSSDHRCLRLPRQSQMTQSNSCDVVGRGSPGHLALGNVSPMAREEISGDFDWLGGTILPKSGRSNIRPRVRLSLWEDTEELGGIHTRPRCDDSSSSGDRKQHGIFGRRFVSVSPYAGEQQGSPIKGINIVGEVTPTPDFDVQGGKESPAERDGNVGEDPPSSPPSLSRFAVYQQQIIYNDVAPRANVSFDDDTSQENEANGGREVVGDQDEDEDKDGEL